MVKAPFYPFSTTALDQAISLNERGHRQDLCRRDADDIA